MDQRALLLMPARGLHVAIIMDGNGRWARARGRPRVVGHREGARAARRIIEAAPGLGIGTLTLYAFSADNWARPAGEVRSLMRLFRAYLRTEVRTCIRQGVRLRVIGRRDRLDPGLVAAIAEAESVTAGGDALRLRIAIDYSARDAIAAAAARLGAPCVEAREVFEAALGAACGMGESTPDVDLLVRTGGEQRLSDFLLWECAYAELYFTRRMWPEFGPSELEAALREFKRRERRFGSVPSAAVG